MFKITVFSKKFIRWFEGDKDSGLYLPERFRAIEARRPRELGFAVDNSKIIVKVIRRADAFATKCVTFELFHDRDIFNLVDAVTFRAWASGAYEWLDSAGQQREEPDWIADVITAISDMCLCDVNGDKRRKY